MNKRDESSKVVKDICCEIVGGKCSNPHCRKEIKGPHSDAEKEFL